MSLLNTISGAASAWTAATVRGQGLRRVDTDADASIDKTELQAAFDKVAEKTGKPARDAEAVIARIDKNGDGAITRPELHAARHELRAAARSTVELAGRSADSSAG